MHYGFFGLLSIKSFRFWEFSLLTPRQNLENEIIHARHIAFLPSEYKDYADDLKILPVNSQDRSE